MLKFVNYFAWILFGSWFFLKLAFQFVVWNRARTARLNGTVEQYVGRITLVYGAIEGFFYLFAIPTWFYWSMVMWVDFDSTYCFKGWNMLDFLNVMMIYCYAFSFALAAACIVPCLICCFPCICQAMISKNREQ